MPNIQIQIISDTVCPWCYIGYRRLSTAIKIHQTNHPTDTFTLEWKAFYLNPSSPAYPGKNKLEMYNQKFGSERVSQMFTRLSAVGKAEGINFSFGGNTGKTRDSHRVIWFAGEQEKSFPSSVGEVGGIQTRVVENLFRAYFEEEKNITHRDVLVDAAVKAGLERSSVDALLDTDEGGEEVDGEAGNAARKLVSGVPFFEIGRYVVEGADEPETFLEIFGKVRDGQ